MEKICKKCAADPSSHSFRKVSEKNGVVIYFGHPSTAKLYDDTEGILEHIDKMLALNGNKKWIFIFDGDGFDVKHAMQIKTGMGFIHLLSEKYGDTLLEVKIINPSWHILGMLKLLSSWIDQVLLSKLKIMDDRKYSVLEFI
jgi:hypothetical protein